MILRRNAVNSTGAFLAEVNTPIDWMVVAGSILKGQCIPDVINQNLDNLKKDEREREREHA